VAVFRARPLVAAAEQLAGVGDPVLGGSEERVRRDVVDEHEFVARVGPEDFVRAAAGGARTAGLEDRADRTGGDAGERRTAQERPPIEAWTGLPLVYTRIEDLTVF